MSSTELAIREERAQGGIIQFAEEMQAIRDGNLYPGAKQEPDAWETYCKERWGQSRSQVDRSILALPVLTARAARGETAISTSTAVEVAELPDDVQNAILSETTTRDDVRPKAAAVREFVRKAEQTEGRTPTVDEQIEVAQQEPKTKKKPTRKMKDSKFISLFSQGYSFVEDAADYAQSNILSDTENDWGWDRVEKLRLQADRIAERLQKPDHVRDWNEEAAVLLGGDGS